MWRLPMDGGEIRWNELAGGDATGELKVNITTYWLTADWLGRSDKLSTPSPRKSYMVRKTNVDLDDINPSLTTNLWKHLKQMYPHIVGDGSMRVRFGWSPNLEMDPTWGDWGTYRLSDGVSEADVKLDTRTTGRYLAMEFDFSSVNAMRFSGADIDVKAVYGR